MVHHRQGLLLGLKAGEHLPRVHARLDDLERHAPLDRMLLLGQEHGPHAAFAEFLQQAIGADLRAGLFQKRLVDRGRGRECGRRGLEKVHGALMRIQQCFHALPQRMIVAAGLHRLTPHAPPGPRPGSPG